MNDARVTPANGLVKGPPAPIPPVKVFQAGFAAGLPAQGDSAKPVPVTGVGPSENVSGLTMGGGLDLPGLSEHMSACAHFDFMFSGTRDQTVGLRDGKDNGTQGILAGAMLGYRFGDAWAMTGGYNLSYMTTSFTGPSERLMNQGTWGLRTNLDHILMVGLNYAR